MSLMNRLRALNREAGEPNRLGLSMVVRYTPEPASGESLAVGVLLKSDDGKTHARWLQDFQRIRCAFGNGYTVHLPLLLRAASEQADRGSPINVPHLSCTSPVTAYGDDVSAVLDSLFHRFVPLAKPHDEIARPAGISVQNRALRTKVFKTLRRSYSDIADQLIAQNPELRFSDQKVRTVMHVPLQGIGKCSGRFGTIVSAQASRPGTVDQNLYPAAAELGSASNMYGIKHRAIFILRPTEGSMPADKYEAIDEHLHDVMEILRGQGNHVVPEVTEDQLAQAIREWGLQPLPRGGKTISVQGPRRVN